jgi:proline dehydrogenase
MNILNQLVVSSLSFTPKFIVAKVADRYIAGEHLTDAVATVKQLNSKGVMATIDVLGEDVTTRSEAIAARDACTSVLHAISENSLDANLSVKLTQIGLKIDKEFCRENVETILSAAQAVNNFVRIDMEDHTCTDATLDVYRAVRKKFSNVGIVIQAYLRRSEDDVKALAAESANVRVCKGIYNEPAAIAFKDRREIQQNYVRLLKILFNAKCRVGIATHDDVLIDAASQIIQDLRLTPQDYEFQMLLGVRSERRAQLVREGHRLRVYTPFGKQWYAYSIRRLKENPQIAGYVFKAMFETQREK